MGIRPNIIQSRELAKRREAYEKAQRELRKVENQVDAKYKKLVAEALLKAIKAGALQQEFLNRILNRFVTAKSEREFLGLEPLPVKAESNGHQQHHEHAHHQ